MYEYERNFSAATNLFWIGTVEAGITCISYTIPVSITLIRIANSWAVILRRKMESLIIGY